ncbi:hypothetical protein TNCV_2605381 [Trichonephila clavipes]|nr:hypothetical protein TNCV_2605381 [Trichonephila clavipes]
MIALSRVVRGSGLDILLWTRSLPRQLFVALHTQWRIVLKGGKTTTVGRRDSAVGACVGHLLVCEETRGEDDWRIMRQLALMSEVQGSTHMGPPMRKREGGEMDCP